VNRTLRPRLGREVLAFSPTTSCERTSAVLLVPAGFVHGIGRFLGRVGRRDKAGSSS